MKSMNLAFATAISLGLAFSGCKKGEDRVPSTPTEAPTTIDKSGGNAAFASLRSTPQVFTVPAGVRKNIKCAEGTVLRFYPNSFKDKNGNIITSGSISVQVTEMYKLGDMIAHRTATITGSGVLISRGEVNIKATMGGQEVFANKYGLGFKTTVGDTQPMELYEGNPNNADSITTWEITKMGVTNGPAYITDSSLSLSESPYFMFDSCTKFTIINCDHPYDKTSKYVTINVVFRDNSFKNTYATLGITFTEPNIATMMGSWQFMTGTHTMTFKGWSPTGAASKFALMIPKSTTEFYYFQQEGTVSDGMSIDASTLETLTSAQVKARLANL